jgi:hypothetical protein
MPQVPFTSFYLGPLAVYPTFSGLQDPITGAPERGGNFTLGNYCDLSEKDAQVWNSQYNPPIPLHQGRYRIVQINSTAVAGYTGFGRPVAWALGQTVQQVSISAAGFNYTPGTYTVTSTASGGTAKATAQVVIGGANNGIIAATLLFGGAGFTSVPTFGLTELTGGTGASLLAQNLETANLVQGYDSSAIALAQPRGVFLSAATAAQVTAGAYVIIQECGIAPVLVNVATATASGAYAAATIGGVVTTTTPATAFPVGYLGTTLDLAAANTLIRVSLDLAIEQG